MRHWVSPLRRISLLLSLMALAACGGGGTGSPIDGGDGGGGGGGGGTGPTDPVFEVTAADGSAIGGVTLSFDTATEIRIRLTDSGSTPIPNETLTYSFEVPDPIPKTGPGAAEKVIASGSATTSASGIAVITLILNDPAAIGAGTLRISAPGVGEVTTLPLTVVSSPGVPANIDLNLVDINSGVNVTGVHFSSGARVEVTVTEADGSLLSQDAIAQVRSDAGQLNASQILIRDGIGYFNIFRRDSDSPGSAVAIETSIAVLDAAGLSAQVDGILFSEFLASGSSGGTAGVPAGFFPTPFLEDPENPGVAVTSISAADPGRLVITVVDVDLDPVPNQIVNVSTTLGSLSPSSGNIATDINGRATILVSVGNGEPNEAGVLTTTLGNLSTQTIFNIVDSGTTSNSGLQLALSLRSAADPSQVISTINSVQPGLVRAVLTNVASGLPVPGEIITFIVDAGAPDLTPGSGQVLTDSNGEATILVAAGDSDPGAAIRLLAEVVDLQSSIQFSVGPADNIRLGRDPDADYAAVDSGTFVLGQIDVGAGANSINLSATGSTTLRVGVFDTDSGALFTDPLTVNFTSNCASAELDATVTTVNGVARSTFKSAAACEGNVTIIASLAEISSTSASGTVVVAGSTANSIEFVSAEPTNIALKGTGGTNRSETSQLTFRVIDNTGEPKPGIEVTFGLSTVLGGIALTDPTGISNNEGLVTAIVSAGTVPTPVQVIASIDVGGTAVSTVSDTLVISTGLPDQNSFSLSATILNPGGADLDGVETTVTIRAADAFNNPVPDGTPVNFRTEYGAVDPSCVTTDGACSVIWRSQNPKQADLPSTGTMRTIYNTACDINGDGVSDTLGQPCLGWEIINRGGVGQLAIPVAHPLGQIYSGRTTIMAYAIGEETFIDSTGSGFYDTVKPFVDLPEAYIDHNEDGVFGGQFTPGGCTLDDATPACTGWQTGGAEETHIDFDSSGTYTLGNGIYNGSLCSEALRDLNQCSQDLVNVRDDLVVLMSHSAPVISVRESTFFIHPADPALDQLYPQLTAPVDVTLGSQTVLVYVSDLQNGYLPAGSTVEVQAENCKLSGSGSFVVGNTSAPGFSVFPVTLSEDDATDGRTSGAITVTVVTNVLGNEVLASTSFSCIDAN